jgi:hypothetical protein
VGASAGRYASFPLPPSLSSIDIDQFAALAQHIKKLAEVVKRRC